MAGIGTERQLELLPGRSRVQAVLPQLPLRGCFVSRSRRIPAVRRRQITLPTSLFQNPVAAEVTRLNYQELERIWSLLTSAATDSNELPTNPLFLPRIAIRQPGSLNGQQMYVIRLPGDHIRLPVHHVRLPMEHVWLPMNHVRQPGDTVRLPGNAVFSPIDAIRLPGNVIRSPMNHIRLPGNAVCLPRKFDFNLINAIGFTTKYTNHTKIKALLKFSPLPRFTRQVRRSPIITASGFVWFGYFVVSTAGLKFNRLRNLAVFPLIPAFPCNFPSLNCNHQHQTKNNHV
jgi:hypothetical protein